MNYLQKNNSTHHLRTAFLWIVGCIVLLWTAGFFFPHAIRTMADNAARPVWIARDKVHTAYEQVIGFFSSKKAIVSRNEFLEDRVATLELRLQDYDTLVRENNDLKALLGHTDTRTRLPARILSKPPQSPYDTMVIDVGSSQGIIPGNRVYISDTIVIGVVMSVTARTALVTLFSSAGEKTTAELLRTGTSFELEGRGGANMRLTVPKETDILWGDTFVYPGISSATIGSVYYIDTESQSSFKTAYIRLPGNVFSSKWLFVEKPL